VHELCARPDLTKPMLEAALAPFTRGLLHSPGLLGDPSPLLQADQRGRTPLHTLCANRAPAVHRAGDLLAYVGRA
jgi:hypothetical protein